jgi:hypothetical protein
MKSVRIDSKTLNRPENRRLKEFIDSHNSKTMDRVNEAKTSTKKGNRMINTSSKKRTRKRNPNNFQLSLFSKAFENMEMSVNNKKLDFDGYINPDDMHLNVTRIARENEFSFHSWFEAAATQRFIKTCLEAFPGLRREDLTKVQNRKRTWLHPVLAHGFIMTTTPVTGNMRRYDDLRLETKQNFENWRHLHEYEAGYPDGQVINGADMWEEIVEDSRYSAGEKAQHEAELCLSAQREDLPLRSFAKLVKLPSSHFTNWCDQKGFVTTEQVVVNGQWKEGLIPSKQMFDLGYMKQVNLQGLSMALVTEKGRDFLFDEAVNDNLYQSVYDTNA